jgi:hypothetical protein
LVKTLSRSALIFSLERSLRNEPSAGAPVSAFPAISATRFEPIADHGIGPIQRNATLAGTACPAVNIEFPVFPPPGEIGPVESSRSMTMMPLLDVSNMGRT